MVGETGWQLSHGEKSSIFLARALLQDSQLVVMDESFAALDPETLEMCLDCAYRRARTAGHRPSLKCARQVRAFELRHPCRRRPSLD